MTCIHCGGRLDTEDRQPASDDNVLARLVEEPGDSTQQEPALCSHCASLLQTERKRRAEFYCLWCRSPLADDGKTPLRDAAPLPTGSDECVMFRTCQDCAKERVVGDAVRALEPRPR